MALGAADGEAVEGGAHHLESVGDVRVLSGGIVLLAGAIGGHAQEAGGGEFFDGVCGEVFVRLRHHFISGKLLAYELIEGFVFVEGVDDVVAVFPGPRAFDIALAKAFAVGVASGVEPVASPAFAVVR